jgi:hypothetical protein
MFIVFNLNKPHLKQTIINKVDTTLLINLVTFIKVQYFLLKGVRIKQLMIESVGFF